MSDARALREAHNDRLVTNYNNVIGTGVGHKMVNGESTGKEAILVFVTEKDNTIRKNDVSRQFIPANIDGIPTDVIEVGHIIKHGFQSRVRPIVPGYSIGHPKVSAGTLGGVFLDRDGHVVVLSNNHVLAAENAAKLGDLIYQPGVMDDPSGNHTFSGWSNVPNTTYFGMLKDFSRLQFNAGKNEQDSAVAQVHPKYVNDRMITANYPNGRAAIGVTEATIGMAVQKFGRTTGQTQGKVMALHSEFTVEYDNGKATFTDCILTSGMSNGGDSGSLLLTEDMKVMGLLFAGSTKVTLYHPIQKVMSKYGLQLWAQPERSQMDFWGLSWRRDHYGLNTFQFQPDLVIMSACANQHALLEADLNRPFGSVDVLLCASANSGASWGPGLALDFPGGVAKINFREGDGFGGYWKGEVHGVGSSKINTWYKLRFELADGNLLGRIIDQNGQVTEILRVPQAQLGGSPSKLRVGKMDVSGTAGDHSSAGLVGRSQFRSLKLS